MKSIPQECLHMNITYTLDRDDLFTYQLYAASTNEKIANKRKRNWIFPPVLYTLTGIFLGFSSNMNYLYLFVGSAVIWILAYPWYSRIQFERHYKNYIDKQYHAIIGSQLIMEFADDHVRMHNEESESIISYGEITGIVLLQQQIILSFRSGAAAVLPRNRIEGANEEDIISFLEAKTGTGRTDRTTWKWE